MKRVEIFVNQSIAEDLQERLKDAGHLEACTRWTPLFGLGKSGPKEGTPIWPETNSGFLLILPQRKLDSLRQVIRELKEEYPEEGLKCFISEGPEEIL